METCKTAGVVTTSTPHVIESIALGTAVEEISANYVIKTPQLMLPLVS